MFKKLVIIIALVYSNTGYSEGLDLGIRAVSRWGKTGNSSKSIASRTMLTHELAALPSILFSDISAGLVLGWQFRRQLREPSEVANTNLAGGGYFLGIQGKFHWESIRAGAEAYFLANYKLSNKDPNDKEIIYKCNLGFCGFGLFARTNFYWGTELEASGSYQRWNRVDVAGTENDISENRLTECRLGLGIVKSFSL